jgi:hypothetical protein
MLEQIKKRKKTIWHNFTGIFRFLCLNLKFELNLNLQEMYNKNCVGESKYVSCSKLQYPEK